MGRYNFFRPIFYIDDQANDIHLVTRDALIDHAWVSSIVANKKIFLDSLCNTVINHDEQHHLSFQLVPDGKVSLHLNIESGHINIGKFDVSPRLFAANQSKKQQTLERLAFEEVRRKFKRTQERVTKGNYKYSAAKVEKHIKERFDMRNFPEVEILSDVRLQRCEYSYLSSIAWLMKDAERNLEDTFSLLKSKLPSPRDFYSDIKECYALCITEKRDQTFYFEPVYHEEANEGMDGITLKRTKWWLRDKEFSPRTQSSLFSVKVTREMAEKYEKAVRTGQQGKVNARFVDMFLGTIMACVQAFHKNCHLR